MTSISPRYDAVMRRFICRLACVVFAVGLLCPIPPLRAQPADELTKLSDRVEKLEVAVFRDPFWPDRPLIVRVEKLEDRLDKLDRAIRELPREQRPAELDDRLDRLERQVKDLSRDGGLEALRRELARRDEAIAAMERRLRALEQRVGPNAGGDEIDRLARALQRVEQTLNRLEDRVTRLENKR